MRIVLANHVPFDVEGSGALTARLAVALQQTGHEVRCLLVDEASDRSDPVPVERIVAHPDGERADLSFAYPRFRTQPQGGMPFDALSEPQLTEYLHKLRTALDAEMDAFNPHIVHAMHAWAWAHLALEAGVPYVISAFADELDELQGMPAAQKQHYELLAQQATENAGRVLAEDDGVAQRLQALYGDLEHRLVVLNQEQRAANGFGPATNWLVDTYRAVLTERFGVPPTE